MGWTERMGGIRRKNLQGDALKTTTIILAGILLLLWMPTIHAWLAKIEQAIKNKIKEIEDENK